MAKKIEPSKALVNSFDEYSKQSLDANLSAMRFFYTANRILCIENGLPDTIYTILVAKGVVNKLNLMYLMACLFINEEVFKAYIKTLPPLVQKMFDILLWQQSITEIDAARKLGEPIVETTKRTYGNYVDKKLHKGFSFFLIKNLSNYAQEHEAFFLLSLPQEAQKIARQYYPKPTEFTLNAVENLEKTAFAFEGESTIFQDLPKITAYYLQDNLKFSTRGKPNVASARKMSKSLSIKEFYTENDALTSIRSYVIASFLGNIDIKKMAQDPLGLLKHLLKVQYRSNQFSLSESLLIDLKGFGYISYGFKKIGENFLTILEDLPAEKWVSIKNIQKYVGIHNLDLLPLSNYDLGNKVYFEKDEERNDYTYKEKYYVGSHTDELVAFPLLNATFFLFAAFGLLEIAYDTVDTTDLGVSYDSIYDGLKYIKLTKLGAYILGFTKTYEFINAPAESSLIFSDDSLIILADGDLSVNEILLKNFTERVSGNRFRVSYDTFLKDCKTRKDLQLKIDLFRQTVNKKLPTNWELFLNELTVKSKAIATVSNLTVLKLPETDRHLHTLIAQDANIKSLVAKAENFQIIVSKENLPKLKSRLKDYGYLLD